MHKQNHSRSPLEFFSKSWEMALNENRTFSITLSYSPSYKKIFGRSILIHFQTRHRKKSAHIFHEICSRNLLIWNTLNTMNLDEKQRIPSP